MLTRGEEIQKEVVAVKDKEGKWHSQSLSKVTQMNSSTISTESQCKSQTQSESQAQTGVQTDVTTSVSVQSSQAEATPDDAGMTTSPVIQPPTPAPDNFYCATDDDVTESCIDQTLNDPTECDLRDPVLYSGRRLKSQDINTVLNAGPCQPDLGYKFPLESGRSFNPDWFLCDMPDTSQYRRNWLSYSISTNKAYCIPCIAFSGPRGSEVWTTTGFDDWRNGSRDVKRHECTAEHRNAEIARLHWRRGKTVCQMARCHNNAIVDDNRKVVSCVIDCVRFLASEMLAFWGDDSAHGKFINLFRLVAKRDPNAAAYLMKIEQTHKDGKRMGVNFISPGNICDILKIMKKMVVEKIVQDIRREKKACIIFDSTQDYSKREASVLLARYMEVDCHGEQRITERLLEVFTTGETSGAVLKECVLDVLKKVKFDIDWIVAQCYDGAGNMRGKYSGMATLIQETCSKAIYIWCHAHRLNLVVNAVARCSNDVKNTLGIIEELYVFMCGHKRNDVFLQEQKQTPGRTVQLKRVSTTRWNSSEAAVDIVLSRYSEVMQALSRMSKAGVYDSETITQATGLRKRLRDIRIIICMHILKMAYHIIGPVSRLLQGISIDLASAAALLSDCKRQFEQLRTNADTEWEKLYQQSAIFASKHGVACELSSVVERRKRKKRMDGELATDESLAGKERMKVETFVTVIDEINEQLRSRFSEQNVTFMKQLSFFTPAGLLCNSQDDVTVDDIRAVCEQYGLSAPDVHKELLDFRSTYRVCCGDVLLDGSMSASEPGK